MKNLILGELPSVLNNEPGIIQREWVKQYGPVVRTVGPVGVERLMFIKPEALHQILVKDWQNPRVSIYFHHVVGEPIHVIVARISLPYPWISDRIWAVGPHWRRT